MFGKVCASVRRGWIQSTRKKFPVCLGEMVMERGVGKASAGNGLEWSLGVAYLGEGFLGRANASSWYTAPSWPKLALIRPRSPSQYLHLLTWT